MRPLQNAVLLTCFFFLALLLCHCNGLTCGIGSRLGKKFLPGNFEFLAPISGLACNSNPKSDKISKMCRLRRPLPTATVQLLLCFFFALLLLLPSECNALKCGFGRRTDSEVLIERIQHECEPEHIGCRLSSCSSGKQQWFAWGCSKIIKVENSNCIPLAIDAVMKDYPSDRPWLCDCTFSKRGESVDMGPPDLPSTITKAPPVPRSTTTTTKGSQSTKSGGGKESRGGRLIVKTHLVVALQMIIGFVPAIFVGLRSRTA
uniref:Uncharacterized protein n=1 Tax=Globodera pallida TaxID=36090 RepID=A0A183BUY0_GLOPA